MKTRKRVLTALLALSSFCVSACFAQETASNSTAANGVGVPAVTEALPSGVAGDTPKDYRQEIKALREAKEQIARENALASPVADSPLPKAQITGEERVADRGFDGITVYVADGVLTRVNFPYPVKRISQAFNNETAKIISVDWVGAALYLKPLSDYYGRPLFDKGNCFVDDAKGNSYPLYIVNINSVDTGRKYPDVNVTVNPPVGVAPAKLDMADILRAVFADRPIAGMRVFTDNKNKQITPDDKKLALWFEAKGLELRIDKIYEMRTAKVIAFSADLINKSTKGVVIPLDQLWWPNLRYSTVEPFTRVVEPRRKVRFYAWLIAQDQGTLMPWLEK